MTGNEKKACIKNSVALVSYSGANHFEMRRKALTQIIRDGISRDERTHYDEAYLLLHVFERYGFVLTDAQREVVAILPKPASVMRIAKRELKARREKRTLL